MTNTSNIIDAPFMATGGGPRASCWLGSREAFIDFNPVDASAKSKRLIFEWTGNTLAIAVCGDVSGGLATHLLELLVDAQTDRGVDRVVLFWNSERGDARFVGALSMAMCGLVDSKRVESVVIRAAGVAGFAALTSNFVVITPRGRIGGLRFVEFPGGVDPPVVASAFFVISKILRPAVSERTWARLRQGYTVSAEEAEAVHLVDTIAAHETLTALKLAL